MIDAGFKNAFKNLVKIKDPFDVIENGYLYIRTVAGLQKFHPGMFTPPQTKLYALIRKLYYERKPIRIRILKPRQTGMSTLSQAIFFSFAITYEYFNALVLSYRTKSATWLFQMMKLAQEQVEKRGEMPVPPLVLSNEKKIEWQRTHSIISIDTEGSPNVALTETRNAALLTEYAYYQDPVTLWADLAPSIPDIAGTMIIIETTANGVGNQFYQEWKAGESGKGLFTNFFFPWMDHPAYAMSADMIERYTERPEDKAYCERHKLTREQYAWFLMNLYDNFHGDRDLFAEKYPATADEAFRAPGGLVFQSLVPLLQKTEAHVLKGTMGRMEESGNNPVFKPGAGQVEIYKEPVSGRRYCAYSDVGEGMKGHVATLIEDGREVEKIDKTYSTTVIRDGDTWELCALMECHFPTDVFSDEAEKLVRYYNNALWGVEIPGPGYAVIGRVQGRYKNLYRTEWMDPDNSYRKANEYGFRNDSKTKPKMETDWEAMVRENPLLVGSIRIIGQALTYMVNPKTAKHEPKPGCFNDILMADFGCIQMLKSQRKDNRDIKKALAGYYAKKQQKKSRQWNPLQ